MAFQLSWLDTGLLGLLHCVRAYSELTMALPLQHSSHSDPDFQNNTQVERSTRFVAPSSIPPSPVPPPSTTEDHAQLIKVPHLNHHNPTALRALLTANKDKLEDISNRSLGLRRSQSGSKLFFPWRRRLQPFDDGCRLGPLRLNSFRSCGRVAA